MEKVASFLGAKPGSSKKSLLSSACELFLGPQPKEHHAQGCHGETRDPREQGEAKLTLKQRGTH